MSQVIAPEIIIDSTPLLVELCSEDFDASSVDLRLPDLETAAVSIKEACSQTSKAINNAKKNLLFAYMSQPSCRRWQKKEFMARLECDSTLLTQVARKTGFKFYTNEKLVVEDLDNNGEEAVSEEVAERTGVPVKTVERIKTKIQKKKEVALEKERLALEESLKTDSSEEGAEEVVETLEVSLSETPKVVPPVVAEALEEVKPIADLTEETNKPDVAMAKELASIAQVEEISTHVKTQLDDEYQEEIARLKEELKQKDEEIARLKALLEDQ
ncbi:MAG: hypothetical protein NE334_02340 [Lentisphaeraceae bacterium]|nr:hypothetical protein [Lentisphaeraceae bacterium]